MPDYGDPQNPFIIKIPEWDDLIKIHPRLKRGHEWEITKRDWAIFFALKERNELHKFQPQEKMREMLRRHLKYEMLKASPTPEVVRSITKILTKLDDAEDALSTFLVLARPLIKNPKFLLGRIGAKLIPGLGWILTIRDLLEIGSMIWKMLPCGRKGKGKGVDMITPWNLTRKARMRRVNRFLAGKFGVPQLIEAAQATEFLFGTGIQIGPILGLLYDFVFGAIRAAAGQTVEVKLSPTREELTWKDAIMQGMAASAGMIFGVPFQWQEAHMLALVAFALGLQNIQDVVSNDEMIRRSDEVLGWKVPHIKPWDPVTRAMFEALGEDPDRDEPHFLPGSPEEITLGDMIRIYQENTPAVVRNLAGMFPGGEEGAFVASTVHEIAMWVWNCDLPVEQWEEHEPVWEVSPFEYALREAYY